MKYTNLNEVFISFLCPFCNSNSFLLCDALKNPSIKLEKDFLLISDMKIQYKINIYDNIITASAPSSKLISLLCSCNKYEQNIICYFYPTKVYNISTISYIYFYGDYILKSYPFKGVSLKTPTNRINSASNFIISSQNDIISAIQTLKAEYLFK